MQLDSRGAFALLVVACILILGAPELSTEWQFFVPGNLSAPTRVAPVLQADPLNPMIDSAFVHADRVLPPTAICIIALDAWHRDYFRASYLLMPRQVWPYQQQLTDTPAPTAALRAAMQRRRATCLLAGAGVRVPVNLVLASRGVYSLYVLPPRSPAA
jgi:hypothetical protein